MNLSFGISPLKQLFLFLFFFKFSVFHQDRKFEFTTSQPPASYFLKKAAGIEKGSSKPGIFLLTLLSYLFLLFC